MKKAFYAVAFLAGAVVGAVSGAFAMNKYIHKHYDISEKTDDDDADDTDTEEPFESVEQNEDDGLSKEEKIIKRANNDILKHVKDPEERKKTEALLKEYVTLSSIYGGEEVVETHDTPYRIMPDQFSEFSDYSAVELTLYSDGIVADDRDEIVPNAEELLGPNFRSMFKEGEDELYIRNDERCCDYAILKDLQTYETLEDERPHYIEEE